MFLRYGFMECGNVSPLWFYGVKSTAVNDHRTPQNHSELSYPQGTANGSNSSKTLTLSVLKL